MLANTIRDNRRGCLNTKMALHHLVACVREVLNVPFFRLLQMLFPRDNITTASRSCTDSILDVCLWFLVHDQADLSFPPIFFFTPGFLRITHRRIVLWASYNLYNVSVMFAVDSAYVKFAVDSAYVKFDV